MHCERWGCLPRGDQFASRTQLPSGFGRAAAGVMEASERVAISATRPGRTNISPPAYYRIIARCIERTGTRPAGHGRLPQNMNRSFGERTGPFRSAIPIDPDHPFRAIPISLWRSVSGPVG
jgi:hypothetical protein